MTSRSTRPITPAERRTLEEAAIRQRRIVASLRGIGYPICGQPFVRLARIEHALRTGMVRDHV